MDGFSLGDFIAALGLAFFVEGIIFIAFPEGAKRMMQTVSVSPAVQLRISGSIAAAIGLVLVWLARG